MIFSRTIVCGLGFSSDGAFSPRLAGSYPSYSRRQSRGVAAIPLRVERLEELIAPAAVWINEISRDSAGKDEDTFIEVAGEAGTSLDGYTIALYNGSTGPMYDSMTLNGVLLDVADNGPDVAGHGVPADLGE